MDTDDAQCLVLKWLKKGEMLCRKAGATPISTCLTQILAVRVLIANDAYYWCFTVASIVFSFDVQKCGEAAHSQQAKCGQRCTRKKREGTEES